MHQANRIAVHPRIRMAMERQQAMYLANLTAVYPRTLMTMEQRMTEKRKVQFINSSFLLLV